MTPQRGSRPRGPRAGGHSAAPAGPAQVSHRVKLEELHPNENPPDIETFTHWDLGPDVQAAIAAMGIAVPTPVQRLAIGPVLEGRDVIAKAETGTGKTLAFGAPIVARLDPSRASVLALVLTPTRELAQQVAGVLRTLGAARGIKVALLVGGDPMPPQIKELQKGAQIVVGTPGRVIDLYKQRFLSFPWTEYAVLDEADEMLEIGFLDDVEKILDYTPPERQTLLFSATFPPPLLALARKHTRTPVEIATAKGVATVDSITQVSVELEDEDRQHALRAMIRASRPDELLLVFCERRTEVDRLMRSLDRLPEQVKALHGGYDQAARFRVMAAFRSGDVRALVATDVASRGLDVSGVTHVINYSVPRDVSAYTHRIGRTGRAGRTGKAITLVSPPQARRWREIEERMTWTVKKVEGREVLDLFGPERATKPQAAEHEGAGDGAPRATRVRRSKPRLENGARTDAAPERPERPERAERPARAERAERPERSERDPLDRTPAVAPAERPARVRRSRHDPVEAPAEPARSAPRPPTAASNRERPARDERQDSNADSGRPARHRASDQPATERTPRRERSVDERPAADPGPARPSQAPERARVQEERPRRRREDPEVVPERKASAAPSKSAPSKSAAPTTSAPPPRTERARTSDPRPEPARESGRPERQSRERPRREPTSGSDRDERRDNTSGLGSGLR